MKESIGGAWIFVICMTFIVLFTGYLAISVNYSKAFRLKSSIVNEIEEANGLNGDTVEKITTYLTSQGYSAYGVCPDLSDTGWVKDTEIDDFAPKAEGKSNVCIYRMDIPLEKNNNIDDICEVRSYYKVVTFFKFDIPVVDVLLTFKVSGDTGYIMSHDNKCV